MRTETVDKIIFWTVGVLAWAIGVAALTFVEFVIIKLVGEDHRLLVNILAIPVFFAYGWWYGGFLFRQYRGIFHGAR